MIREAREEDIHKLCLLAFGEWMDHFTYATQQDFSAQSVMFAIRQLLQSPDDGFILVAEAEDKVVGFILCQVARFIGNLAQPICHEIGWFVDEAHRGKGLGFSLLDEAEKASKAKGWVIFSLGTPGTDSKLLGKYKQRGYIPYQTMSFKYLGDTE